MIKSIPPNFWSFLLGKLKGFPTYHYSIRCVWDYKGLLVSSRSSDQSDNGHLLICWIAQILLFYMFEGYFRYARIFRPFLWQNEWTIFLWAISWVHPSCLDSLSVQRCINGIDTFSLWLSENWKYILWYLLYLLYLPYFAGWRGII